MVSGVQCLRAEQVKGVANPDFLHWLQKRSDGPKGLVCSVNIHTNTNHMNTFIYPRGRV